MNKSIASINSVTSTTNPVLVSIPINATVTSSGTIKPSQYRGVYKCGKKWKSQIQINGKQEYLGIFKTETEAAIAYDHRALEVDRVDCINYTKRGGKGNPGRIYEIIKKKIQHGRMISTFQEMKTRFVEMILSQIDSGNRNKSTTDDEEEEEAEEEAPNKEVMENMYNDYLCKCQELIQATDDLNSFILQSVSHP